VEAIRGKNNEDEKGNGGDDFARAAHGNTSRGEICGSATMR
jgi:hypothetical protein